MCGIVGILGINSVAPLLVDALKRLEYRGYDSAGVATIHDGHLGRRRAAGKLRNLELFAWRESLARNDRYRTYPLGRLMAFLMKPTPIPIRQAMLLRSIMASSRISANCGRN